MSKPKARRTRSNKYKATDAKIPNAIINAARQANLRVYGSIVRGTTNTHIRYYFKSMLVAEWWSGNCHAKIGPRDTHFDTIEDMTNAVVSAMKP